MAFGMLYPETVLRANQYTGIRYTENGIRISVSALLYFPVTGVATGFKI
jgi:hypothetical protein